MPMLVSKAATLYRNRGSIAVLKRGVQVAYESVVPRTTASHNGVTVRSGHALDGILPWTTLHQPEYEAGLVAGIEATVDSGDTVIVVGGGWGVSTVAAARMAGTDGAIHTFEAAAEAVENVRETLALNDVTGRTTVTHAVVAENISTRGTAADADLVAPSDLLACDVLVLDCEGAELSIINGLDKPPRDIVVETHGQFGAPPSAVREVLIERGYTVTDKRIAEPDERAFCIDNEIHVLRAHREDP